MQDTTKRQQKEKVDQLVARAKSDPAFKQQAKEDPVGTLRQAGLNDEAIGDLLREEGLADLDPEGRKPKVKDAIQVARESSCWFTCAKSDGYCWVTI